MSDLFEMAKTVQAANLESFRAGWKAGCTDALRLATGKPASGGSPYPHPETLPADFLAWVEQALAKIDAG